MSGPEPIAGRRKALSARFRACLIVACLWVLAHEADDFILPKRVPALDAEALDPLPGKVTLEPHVDGCGDAHGDERPQAGHGHVLMRIPNVSLRAQVSLTGGP